MAAIVNYIRVPFSSYETTNSEDNSELEPIYKYIEWEAEIRKEFSLLYGYFDDLKEKGLTSVVYGILFEEEFSDELEGESFYNIELVREVYISYLTELIPENDEEGENEEEIKEIKDKIDVVSGNDKNQITELLIEIGILEGVSLAVPFTKVKKNFKAILGEDIYLPTNTNSLYLQYWSDVELSEKYKPVTNQILTEHNVDVTVYIFSRMKGELIDITTWLSSVTTNVTNMGGNFSLQLELVDAIKSRGGGGYYSDSPLNEYGDINNIAYLQNLIRENDLIFIKFEKLQLEEVVSGSKQLKVKDNIWDLIGLVDTNTISTSVNTLGSFTVEGRDLIKLLIEDQNFFIPYQFSNNLKTTFGGNSSKIFNRLFATGQYQLEFIYSLRSIELTLGFIISQLSNMEVLSDEGKRWLSREYGNSLSKQIKISQSGIAEQGLLDGIWGIVKLLIDEKVQHYRIADPSISQPDGSILNQIQKICQEPFVEFHCDTFGDTYNIIARRPPFDYDSITSSVMVKISDINILSENLSFDTEVFSVFQISPQGALLGGTDSLPLSYIPMIVLDEYVNMWGNKLYNAVTNYIDYDTYIRADDEIGRKTPKETFIEDLCWLIETMAYKPFTRRGTITINGDRRIKRGNWIYSEKSGEIFYVDSVQNLASIGDGAERVTTLQVSRGMVWDFVGGNNRVKDYQVVQTNYSDITKPTETNVTSKVKAGYFELIDIDFLRESLKRNLIEVNTQFTLSKEIVTDLGALGTASIVNSGVFDFFCKGYQFSSSRVKKNDADFNEILPPKTIR